MSFHVGQKVVQRRPWASNDTGYPDVAFTRCGPVYTVREIADIDGDTALLFFEIKNPIRAYRNRGFMEQVFPAWNFSPIVSRKTDIAIFKRMLLPQGVDA